MLEVFTAVEFTRQGNGRLCQQALHGGYRRLRDADPHLSVLPAEALGTHLGANCSRPLEI
jgi:hypothetical protein